MSEALDVIEQTLKAAGAKRLISSNQHPKYRLPTGQMFTYASTPSDHRSNDNSLSYLRKMLRPTHPHLAIIGRNLPKNRRVPSNTLEELIAERMPVSPLAAIPGSSPASPPPPPVTVVVIEPPPSKQLPQPERKPVPVVTSLPYREFVRDSQVPSHVCHGLAPEQLSEANRILKDEGDKAMNTYLNSLRDKMLEIVKAPPAPTPTTTTTPARQQVHAPEVDTQMADILTRARAELSATAKRLSQYDDQIAKLKASQEDDVLKQIQLEEYIKEHEALAAKAVDLLKNILPVALPVPAAAPEIIPPLRRRHVTTVGRKSNSGFGIRDVIEKIFPAMKDAGIQIFHAANVSQFIERSDLPRPFPSAGSLSAWLNTYAARYDLIQRGPVRGSFRFTPEIAAAPSSYQQERVQ